MSEAHAPDGVANPITRMLTTRQRPRHILFFLQKTITRKFAQLPTIVYEETGMPPPPQK